MIAYYNEIDPYAAQWLRNLIAAGHIAPGDVDERSIVDVKPGDLRSYTQCHFFAGIGGWSYALRLAGWPDDRPVWTGSCPCQPFSTAGKGKAGDAIVLGEQVEAAIGWGWLDLVLSDLEGEGYACGAAVLPACGVGAPHIRQRLWFVADAESGTRGLSVRPEQKQNTEFGGGGEAGELANGDHQGLGIERIESTQHQCASIERSGAVGDLGKPEGEQPYGTGNTRRRRREPTNTSPWRDLQWLPCTDGKARPTQPGIFPLAHGIPARVGKLRAAGNAIVPQVAAEFIRAAMT